MMTHCYLWVVYCLILLGVRDEPIGGEYAVIETRHRISNIAVASDSDRFAVSNSNDEIVVCGVRAKGVLQRIRLTPRHIVALRFDQTGNQLIALSRDPENLNASILTTIHLASGNLVKERRLNGIALDIANSRIVATATRLRDPEPATVINVIDVELDRTVMVSFKVTADIRKAQLSTDGRYIAALFAYGDVRLGDCQSGKETARLKVDSRTDDVFVVPGSDLIVTRKAPFSEIWSLSSGNKISTPPIPTATALLASGRIAISWPHECFVFYDVQARRETGRLSIAPIGPYRFEPRCIVVTNDEQYLIGAGIRGRIGIWRIPKNFLK